MGGLADSSANGPELAAEKTESLLAINQELRDRIAALELELDQVRLDKLRFEVGAVVALQGAIDRPKQLAAVLNGGRLSWGGRLAHVSPGEERLLLALLTEAGQIHGAVGIAELIAAVYCGSTQPALRLTRSIRKLVDRLRDKLYSRKLPLDVRWTGRGELLLVDNRRISTDTPVSGTRPGGKAALGC